MYVCVCKAVTERQIRDAVRDGATALKDVRRKLGVSSECGQCAIDARACLAAAVESQRRGSSASAPHFHGVDIAQTPGNHAADGLEFVDNSGAVFVDAIDRA